MSVYWVALIALAYYLWRCRFDSLGASLSFLWIILIFHGPMLYVFTQIWVGEFQFGQLPHLVSNIASEEVIENVYIAFTLCVICVIFGVYFYNLINRKTFKDCALSAAQRVLDIGAAYIVVWVSSAFIIIYLVVQYSVVASPLQILNYYFSSIGEFEKVDIRRSAALSFYPYQLLMATFFPFLSFAILAQSVNGFGVPESTRRKFKSYAVFFTLLVFLGKISQYNKAGPIIYGLQIVFVLFYSRSNSFRLRAWHLKVSLLGMVVVFLVTSLVNNTENFALTMFSAFDRTFMIPNEGVFEYFSVIPLHIPHGYGAGIGVVSALLGDPSSGQIRGTYWEVSAVVRGGYGSTSNSFFIADAWAEFSWAGVILFSFVAGWLLRWHDHQVMRWGTSPVAVALLVSGYGGAYTLGTTALTTAMITGGLVLTPMLANLLLRKRANPRKAI